MLTAIRGLRGQRRLRVEVVNQLNELLIDVVVGRAATRLRRAEGIAAWLRSDRGGRRQRKAA